MNVLDLRGPDFLKFYSTLMLAATVAALLLRQWLRSPGGGGRVKSSELPELHPFEIAYLAGGAKAVIDAAIASLVHRGSLAVDTKMRRLRASTLPPTGVTPMETAVFRAVETGDGKVSTVRSAVADIARSTSTRLQSLQLVPDAGQATSIRLFPAMVIVLVIVLGALKINVGMQRHRPVGFLIPMVIANSVGAALFAFIPPRRTRKGARVLELLRIRNAALRTTAGNAPNSLVGDDVATAFALYGAGVFMWGPMADLRQTLAPPAQGGSGCGGGSSCGGSSCGGGGGCGGGGCGGCGS
jgi:uncharacterized protein (TIGR04222 family)